MGDYLNFFSHEQVSDSLILFTEGYSMVHRFTIGVIVGRDKVLVVDAGLGMSGDFRKQIEKVVGTDRPIICACTHSNIDHVASSKQFDEAYLSQVDIPDTPRGLVFTRRMSDLAAFSLNNKEVIEYGRKHAIHNEDSKFIPFEEGFVFDLGGGVEIETIAVPGHTTGSIAFFNRKEKYCLTGDAINADCHIGRLDREGFRTFADTVQRFIDIVGDDVTFYSGHLPLPQKIGVAKNLVEAAKEVADGKFDGDVPMVGIFQSQTTPKKATGRFHIHGNTLLVYNTDRCDPEKTYDINTTCVFGHEKVSDHIYVVTESYSVVHRLTIGVVEGDDKVLVIDAGLGMNPDLRKYIESIVGTEKPIVCAITHGAVDHIGAVSQFDEAFLNSEDLPLLPWDNDVDHRLGILYSFCIRDTTIVDYFRDKYLPIEGIEYKNVVDGDVFNLGGVRIEVVSIPGHTPGSVAYLCRKEKVVFTGDAVNADTYLFEMDEDDLTEYADTLERFAKIVNDDEVTVYAGHLNRGQTFNTVYNLAAACREVAAGETLGDPPAQSSFVFEREIKTRRLHYHGNTCVCYDRANFKA